MKTMYDFLQEKEVKDNKLDYLSVFNYLKKLHHADLLDVEDFKYCEAHHLFEIEMQMVRREKEVFLFWQDMFERKIAYKKPFFVNSDCIRYSNAYREIYLAPVFAKSGRHIFVIQGGDSAETLEVYTNICDFRQEDIPPKDILDERRTEVKKFIKPATVFAKWHEDHEQDSVRDKCLYEHDYLQWRNKGKGHEQQKKIEELFFDNFYLLKSIFLEISAETNWP